MKRFGIPAEIVVIITIGAVLGALVFFAGKFIPNSQSRCNQTAPLNCRIGTTTQDRDICYCQDIDYQYEIRWVP